jgi:hypothetical protein
MFQKVTKKISDIEGMENYRFYYATTDGEIYSAKYKKPRRLREYWCNNGNQSYKIVQLSDGKGNKKSFYIHRIIAKLWLPNPTDSWGVEHIDKNPENNALSNLRWIGRKKERNGVIGLDTDQLELSKDLSDYIRLVHGAAIRKNIPVPDTYQFFHDILNESLNEYINRFGLKKTMYLLENGTIQ